MRVKNMTLCGLFVALIAICAWLSIPLGSIAITLQTFAVFLCLGLLGGKLGSVTILVYLLLGLVGVPVFSGFRGGATALMGATGGYIFGFLAAGLIYWLFTHFRSAPGLQLFAMFLGLLICYAIGSAWFCLVYLPGTGLGAVLLTCVAPYLLPDICKLLLAWFLSRRLHRFV